MASPIGKLSVVVLVLPLSSAVPPTGNACLLLPPSLHIFDTSKHLNTVMIRISFTSFTEPHIVIMIDWMIIQYSIFNIQSSIFWLQKFEVRDIASFIDTSPICFYGKQGQGQRHIGRQTKLPGCGISRYGHTFGLCLN